MLSALGFNVLAAGCGLIVGNLISKVQRTNDPYKGIDAWLCGIGCVLVLIGSLFMRLS